MKRSKFNLTHLHSTTGEAGYLIPFFLQSTLPGDRYRISLTSFIRAQPMLAPLMHQVKFYTQYWFVPYRILWDNWEPFITGGNALQTVPSFPVIKAPATDGWKAGSLADYFGFPINQPDIEVSAMPFRAMAEIWNTRYRDEDLQEELPVSYTDGTDTTTSTDLLSPSWKRDYFTTARPFTQRGTEVGIPVTQNPVNPTETFYRAVEFDTISINSGFPFSVTTSVLGITSPNNSASNFSYSAMNFVPDTSSVEDFISKLSTNGGSGDITGVFNVSFSGSYQDSGSLLGFVSFSKSVSIPGSVSVTGAQLVTSQETPFTSNVSLSPQSATILSNKQTSNFFPYSFSYSGKFTASASTKFRFPIGTTEVATLGRISVRDLRASSALQRYAERSLEWGNRYEEFIQREFGIKPRDSRIQRPEYLGGGSGNLQISEVLQTAEGTDTGVGTMRGHAVAGVGQRPIKFTCPEHGLILGLISIRPVPVYTQGIEREFLKRSRLDFFTPELANIGMQEVLQQELYATKDNKDTVFGYSERYQEYRYRKPMVTGQFRTDFSFWNMARHFEFPPTLNDTFINMSSSKPAFKRPFAITSDATHSFLMMLRNNIRAWRPIPKRAHNLLK